MKIDLSRALLNEKELNLYNEALGKAEQKLQSGKEAFTGWVKLPYNYDRNEIGRLVETASKIRQQCEVLIVIGIGGSYLGSKACIEMLSSSFDTGRDQPHKPRNPRIYFAGCNLSGTYHAELLEAVADKEVCLCVISKSGTTAEPNIAFSVLKDHLYQKYGKEGTRSRIYAITDAARGVLREEVEREGYDSFIVPDDIGGRYSVLTPVGLLPIAVAGIDIYEILEGAQSRAETTKVYSGDVAALSDAELFAAARQLLNNKGKLVEVYEYYEPKLEFFMEWLKQLFGESQGKEGKGLFPASLQFTADLHSMGQFLQEGNQLFFETVFNVAAPEKDILVPKTAEALLAGRSMNAVNQAAITGVMAAHEQAGIPMIKIDIPELTAFYFGQMVYFFEKACALGGYLLEVDPFTQPGVESYKSEMRSALLKK
jgi:glucose-6-phosphate isomerase